MQRVVVVVVVHRLLLYQGVELAHEVDAVVVDEAVQVHVHVRVADQ